VSSPQSHAANDSLEQTNIAAVVDNTAEEHSMDKQLSLDVIAAEFNETEADASSDDASSDIVPLEGEPDPVPVVHTLVSKQKQNNGSRALQRVSFSPLALLLDASLEGDLELVMNTAKKVCCKLFATKPIC